MARGRPEQRFVIDFQKSLLDYGENVWVYKIPDTPVIHSGLTASIPFRFSSPKPFDIMAVMSIERTDVDPTKRRVGKTRWWETRTLAFELKYHNKHTAFPFSRVEDHQLESLLRFSKSGGVAYIAILIEFALDTLSSKLREAWEAHSCDGAVSKCVLCTAEAFSYAENRLAEQGRRSIPLLDLFSMAGAIEAPRRVGTKKEDRRWHVAQAVIASLPD